MKKIVIDIDDTVADSTNYLMEYALEFDKDYVKGEGIVNKEFNMPRCFNWTSEETKLFLDKIYDKYVDKIPPISNSKEIINKLKELGYEIIFVSSRNNNQMSDPYNRTKNWLANNNISFDKLIINIKYKGTIIEEEKANVFIDDSVGQTTYVANHYDVDVIQFSNKESNYENIKVLNDWNDIFNYIVNKEV